MAGLNWHNLKVGVSDLVYSSRLSAPRRGHSSAAEHVHLQDAFYESRYVGWRTWWMEASGSKTRRTHQDQRHCCKRTPDNMAYAGTMHPRVWQCCLAQPFLNKKPTDSGSETLIVLGSQPYKMI